MTCYSPLSGFRAVSPNSNGKYPLVFSPREGFSDKPIDVPCGQCVGCRLERSRQWAVRCMHEASLYENNVFITLTYSDDFLPYDQSLDVRHFQLFMKRLRKKFPGVRFYHCGEYGGQTGRPHYHAILFNCDFPDKKIFSVRNGNRVYTSQVLNDIWGMGLTEIGSVTFQSAAYVARYIMKKVTGEFSDDAYQWLLPNGEIVQRKPEYTTMSRKPGIGKGWYDKYSSEVYPLDRVLVRGSVSKPPRFYDSHLEVDDPAMFRDVKISRVLNAKKILDNSDDRMLTKLKHKEISIKSLVRPLL